MNTHFLIQKEYLLEKTTVIIKVKVGILYNVLPIIIEDDDYE